MLYGKVELDKIPPNLIAWAFMIAGEMLQPPKKPVGAPANPGHMRNLKILSVVDYLGWELGYSKAKSCRLVAKVIDRDVETVKTALDNGEKASKTHPGVYIFNWLELMGEKLI